MATDKQIQILLSTYNGERYLREQLDSYLAQTVFHQCQVLIRDDGSQDGTRRILEEYRDNHGFRVVFGENIGVNKSYQWLVDHADHSCDFFALSDQDDVWIPEKLERASFKLKKENMDLPLLYASRSQIVDAELRYIGESILPKKGTAFYNAMVQNVCPGHTQVFNKKVLEILRAQSVTKAVVFDWWVYLTAAGLGKVCFDKVCTVMHRQHGDNAVGYGVSFWQLLWPRIKRFISGDSYKMAEQLQEFALINNEKLPEEYRTELICFLLNSKALYSRLPYILRCKVYRQSAFETFCLKVCYLLGKYSILTMGVP